MKIESTMEKLSLAINRIQKVSSKNLSLPILENVLLIAKDNTLLIRSTNLHVGTEVSIPVKIDIAGEVAVKMDLFINIINSIRFFVGSLGESQRLYRDVKQNIHA